MSTIYPQLELKSLKEPVIPVIYQLIGTRC